MADTLVLHLSEDAYLGDAQFTVDVDGVQIAGPTSVTTAHSSGTFQNFTYTGDFGAGPLHTVAIHFINDAWGGTADTDRNLYVGGITFDGVDYSGEARAQNDAMNGKPDSDPNAAEMFVNGTVTFGGVGSRTLDAGPEQDIFVQANGEYGATVINDFMPGAGGDILDLRGYGIDYDYVSQHLANIAKDSGSQIVLPNGDSVVFFGAFGSDSADKFTADNFRFDGVGPSPSGSDMLVLHLSEDAYLGDAQFAVLVDGTRIGGPISVTTPHGSGFQDFTFDGDFGSGPHTVAVQFLNDAWGGTPDTDRNLYVGGITFNGVDYAGETAQNDAMNGKPDADPNAAEMYVDGSVVFSNVGGSSPPPDVGLHTLTVSLAEDAWNGDAQFTLDVDGVQIAGPTPVVVKHGDGFQQFTYTEILPDRPHSIDVHFINDAYGGSPDADRNLYVGGVSFDTFGRNGELAQNDAMNGQPDADPTAAEMYVNGTVSFPDITQGSPGHPPPNTVPMTLHLSEDAWNGDAQFTVVVDGRDVLGTRSVAVAHSSGDVQDFTFFAQVGAGTHTVAVNFLNDAWGGTPDTDRNLYVSSLDINGVHFQGNTADNNAANGHASDDPSAAVMDVNGTATFTFDQSQVIHTAPPEIMG